MPSTSANAVGSFASSSSSFFFFAASTASTAAASTGATSSSAGGGEFVSSVISSSLVFFSASFASTTTTSSAGSVTFDVAGPLGGRDASVFASFLSAAEVFGMYDTTPVGRAGRAAARALQWPAAGPMREIRYSKKINPECDDSFVQKVHRCVERGRDQMLKARSR
eukprot:30985-Pelagococcus_subviridis.AAC.2